MIRKPNLLVIVVLLTTVSSCHKDAPSPIIYQTSFNSGDKWPNVISGPVLHFVSDHYEIGVTDENDIVWAYVPCGYLEVNYSIAVDLSIHADDNKKLGSAGIIFNHLDNNNYEMFLISNLRSYKIVKKTIGKFVIIQDWTVQNAIALLPNGPNRLEIDQLENSAEFKINSVSIGSFPLTRATDFKIGIGTATAPAPDYTPVMGSFDNLIVSKYPN